MLRAGLRVVVVARRALKMRGALSAHHKDKEERPE